MDVLLAQPRGFCAGVDRAIEIVDRALRIHGAPIYVRHEIVHNTFVVEDLRSRGAVFIEDLDQVPAGATVVFSAHGVARAVQEHALRRGLRVFDATCPLVTKVHVEVARMRAQGRDIVMIGHKGHPEVEGTMGQIDGGIHLVETVADVARLQVRDARLLAYVTQTTLSLDDASAIVAALKQRFPQITEPKRSDICYATQNRQDAVKFLAPQVQVVIVVGSASSSNSNRLREVAERMGVPAFLVDRAQDIDPAWMQGRTRIGLTAGASAPEVLVREVTDRLRELGARTVRCMDGVIEDIVFPLPKGLGAGLGAGLSAAQGAAPGAGPDAGALQAPGVPR
jgi:4-hydroxy-3-methylbut-2-enyl diphosphate reductase